MKNDQQRDTLFRDDVIDPSLEMKPLIHTHTAVSYTIATILQQKTQQRLVIITPDDDHGLFVIISPSLLVE